MTMAVVVFSLLVLAFAAATRHLSRYSVTAPIAFVAAGALISTVTAELDLETVLQVRAVAEVTLALVLFHDAAQVRPRQIRGSAGLVARLLFVALPLTVLLGYLVARVTFPTAQVMTCLLLAAALAPTDAGLGAATVLNPVVPVRIRQLLNVESGINDGLVTPVALFAIAAIAGTEASSPGTALGEAVVELGVGAAVGVAVGAGSGLLLGWSARRGLSTPHSRSIAVLALPVLAFFLAESLHANAFVAAFVAGTAFAGASAWADEEDEALELTETLAEPLGFAVWLVFGLAATPLLVQHLGWREVLFALASLTVFRMVPVALSLLGTGLRAPSVAFLGWFGPRGLATIVFALIALESLEQTATGRRVLATAALTVLLSVFAHGLTADVLARRYGAWAERTRPPVETSAAEEPRGRRSVMDRAEPAA